MDVSTYEGRAAYIAGCERICRVQDERHKEMVRQQREHEARVAEICQQAANAINAPLHKLISDIRAMR